MFQIKLNNWLKKFKQYFFTYSKGFYHLPYNGKSPETLVESFAKYPFVKHNKEKQSIFSSNPFCEGGFHYHKLEEGCWILYSRMRYKANVAFDLVYDGPEERPDRGEGHYMLSLNHVSNEIAVDKTICQQQVCLSQYNWTLFKPHERNCDLNFKGASNKYITLYFNDQWLNQNLVKNSLFTEGGLQKFIESDQGYLSWPIGAKDPVLSNFKLFDEVMNIDGPAAMVDHLSLKYHTINLIFTFFKVCKEENVIGSGFPLEYQDKFNIARVENYLANHLVDKFPGIDMLADRFQISESKLKAEFKQHYGKPLYQYFRDKQMDLARELLIDNHLLVKEISYKLGYENISKFSAAFKKHHGVLPSDLQKQELNIAG